jgi:TRAP-type C4-dicarboxylate transport system substrate-binding protein
LQELVADAFIQMADVQFQYNMEYEGKSLAAFAKAGGKIHVPTADERKTFTVAKDHMRKWFVDKYGVEWIEKAEKAVAAAEADITKERAMLLSK